MREGKSSLSKTGAGSGLILVLLLALFCCPGRALASVSVKVTVEGITGPLLENVMKYLSLEQQKTDPALTDGIVRRLHGRAEKEIQSALQPFGYYNPSVSKDLKREDAVWHARYVIDPGVAVTVTELDLLLTGPGEEDGEFKKLAGDFPVKVGDTLIHSRYEEGKKALLDLALNRGYLDARFALSRLEVYPEKNSARVILHFDTGARYRFGEVSFEQDTFDPAFLQRFVRIERGDPFTLSDITALQNSLRNSDYFSDINIEYRRDLAKEREVPVEVKLEPRKRNAYGLGIGFGTDTGIRGSLGWTNRRINEWGHRSLVALRVSEIKSSLSGRYTVPLSKPSTDSRVYTVGYFTENPDTSDSEMFMAGLSFNHLYGRWRRTLFLNYEREDFTVGSDSGQSDLIIPGASWTYTKADDTVYTTLGWRVLFEIKGAFEDFVSDLTFLQLLLHPKFIYGLGGFGRIILRGEGGTILIDNFSELPASHRFFAGGDQSVRGYKYKDLGPVDENGDVIGGKHILVGSIEYEQRLFEKWSAAIFYDVGNAINSLSDPYKEGAGFGIRWISPVGLFRLDLAFALSRPGDPLRLHLTIGPDL